MESDLAQKNATMSLSIFLLLLVSFWFDSAVSDDCTDAVRVCRTTCQASEFEDAVGRCANANQKRCCPRLCERSAAKVTCGHLGGCFELSTRTVTTPTRQRTADCAVLRTRTMTKCTTGCADCVVMLTAWSACSVCGDAGRQTRTRSITTPAVGSGLCQNATTEARQCVPLVACPVPSASTVPPTAAPRIVPLLGATLVPLLADSPNLVFMPQDLGTIKALASDGSLDEPILTASIPLGSIGVAAPTASSEVRGAGLLEGPYVLRFEFFQRRVVRRLALVAFSATDRGTFRGFDAEKRAVMSVPITAAETVLSEPSGFFLFELSAEPGSSFGLSALDVDSEIAVETLASGSPAPAATSTSARAPQSLVVVGATPASAAAAVPGDGSLGSGPLAIGLSVTVLVLLIAGVSFLVWLRRRRRRK